MNTAKLRMSIDLSMTILSIILMGGIILFPDDRIHQVLGFVLFPLWIVHMFLNHHWYAAIFRRPYFNYRLMQLVINLGLTVTALLVLFSGAIMAWFISFDFGQLLGVARMVHLVGSHWYYLFMCAHIGMHLGVIGSRMFKGVKLSRRLKITLNIVVITVCAYGIYAFIIRGIVKYLFMKQEFFFFDLERGYILFAIDYLSILIMIAALTFQLSKFVFYRDWKKKRFPDQKKS